jgi:hypothetical protein
MEKRGGIPRQNGSPVVTCTEKYSPATTSPIRLSTLKYMEGSSSDTIDMMHTAVYSILIYISFMIR